MKLLKVFVMLVLVLAAGAQGCDCGWDDFTIQDCPSGRQWTHAGADLVCYDETPLHHPLTFRKWNYGQPDASPPVPGDNEVTACAFCDGVYNPDGGTP